MLAVRHSIPQPVSEIPDGAGESVKAVLVFPEDVVVWRFFVVNAHRRRARPSAFTGKRITNQPVSNITNEFWRDVILHAGPEYVISGSPTRAVHVYAVRHDGSLLAHHTRMHHPGQIFRIYPNGTAVLRLFTNAGESIISVWPRDCDGIPKIPGIVVVVSINEAKVRSRHVFLLPESVEEPWKNIVTRSSH